MTDIINITNNSTPQDDTMVVLNVTYNGENGDFYEPINRDLTDREVKDLVVQGLREGRVRGVEAVPNADIGDFVVDRYLNAEVPKIMVRPKVTFGAG